MKNSNLGRLAAILALGIAAAAPSFAADSLTGKTSFGFQGVAAGNIVNGASVRSWTNGKFGWEANVAYGAMKISPEGEADIKANLTALEGKGMWALIERTNSKFYVGGKIAYGKYKLNDEDRKTETLDGHLTQFGVLAGTEFCIPQLPEVGFNFEVGYNITKTDNTIYGNAMDIRMHGVNVGIGIHYNF